MKFATVFAVLATVATAVSATFSSIPQDTNAKRFALGLKPLPPVRRDPSPSYGAPKGKPSGKPPGKPPGITNSCNSGPVQCCNSLTTANSAVHRELIKALDIIVGPDVAIGVTCSPLTTLGVGSKCVHQTVCCENNKFNGIVAIGCSPINVNLV